VRLPVLQRRLLVAVCSAVALCAPKMASAQSQPTTYAIIHAKVFTLSGAAIDDGTVVIQNGKIANVGAAVEVPTGAQVIDGKGLQVYPGLFDPVTQNRAEIVSRNAVHHGRSDAPLLAGN